jgi:hypothetical protein
VSAASNLLWILDLYSELSPRCPCCRGLIVRAPLLGAGYEITLVSCAGGRVWKEVKLRQVAA